MGGKLVSRLQKLLCALCAATLSCSRVEEDPVDNLQKMLGCRRPCSEVLAARSLERSAVAPKMRGATEPSSRPTRASWLTDYMRSAPTISRLPMILAMFSATDRHADLISRDGNGMVPFMHFVSVTQNA
jgi:hypothetical protein